MKDLFYPEKVAVIGVSDAPDNLGKAIIRNLLEYQFQGKIYPIGPRGGEVFGKKIYTSVKELPEGVDFAAFLIPAPKIPQVLEECGQKGVKRAAILTGGFRELDENRKDLEGEILKVAQKYGIRFSGPNAQGVVNAAIGLCIPFGVIEKGLIKKGKISLLAQSGSVAFTGAFLFSHECNGIAKMVSLGNKLNIDEVELLEYLLEDEETEIIALYLESISRGRELYNLARRSKKPIIAFKSNISGKNSEVAFSHTASLATDDRVVDCAFRQAGIIRAHNLREMADCIKVLSLPPLKGKSLGVICSSGGMSVISEDACFKAGFTLPKLPQDILIRIEDMGRAKVIRLTNPVDTGDIFNASELLEIVDMIIKLPYIHGIMLSAFHAPGKFYGGMSSLDIIEKIKEISKQYEKPMALHFVTDPMSIENLRQETNYPIFSSVQDAIYSLAKTFNVRGSKVQSSRFKSLKIDPEHGTVNISKVNSILSDSNKTYLNLEAMEVLEAYGIPVAKPLLALNLQEAKILAREIGYPVVMKIHSPDIIHKTDVGGVKVGIQAEGPLDEAYHEIMDNCKEKVPDAIIEGVVIQKMIPDGIEVIVGGRYDEHFGPLVMFGMGGIYVEILEDVSFRLAPISEKEALEMIEEVKGSRLLRGLRGEKPADQKALVKCMMKISQLMVDFPGISEVDINPMKVLEEGKGAWAVDARMSLRKSIEGN